MKFPIGDWKLPLLFFGVFAYVMFIGTLGIVLAHFIAKFW